MSATPVVVPDDLISDGQVPRPRVGDAIDLAITFIETEADAVIAKPYDVRCELLEEAPRQNRSLSGEYHGNVWYRELVHGTGWSASWKAPRRVEGEVQLTGALYGSYNAISNQQARIKGMISRIQLVDDYLESRPNEPLGWAPDLERRVVREVYELPRFTYIDDRTENVPSNADASVNSEVAGWVPHSPLNNRRRSVVVHVAVEDT